MCFFNTGNIEGTNSSNVCVCMCYFILCTDWFCGVYLKGFTYNVIWEEFWNGQLLMTLFDRPMWPCALDGTFKANCHVVKRSFIDFLPSYKARSLVVAREVLEQAYKRVFSHLNRYPRCFNFCVKQHLVWPGNQFLVVEFSYCISEFSCGVFLK